MGFALSTSLDVISGLSSGVAYKVPCAVATTIAMDNAMVGLPAIDGYQLVAGDRILVWQNTDQTTNGVYNCQAGGAWTRAIDFSNSSAIAKGTQIFIAHGTLYAGGAFELTTEGQPGTIQIGTALLTFIVTTFSGQIQAFFAGLPTVLPATAGVVWNNGGVIAVS